MRPKQCSIVCAHMLLGPSTNHQIDFLNIYIPSVQVFHKATAYVDESIRTDRETQQWLCRVTAYVASFDSSIEAEREWQSVLDPRLHQNSVRNSDPNSSVGGPVFPPIAAVRWPFGRAAISGLRKSLRIYRRLNSLIRRAQARSKRSRFITLAHAAAKSFTNPSFESSHP